MPNPAAPAHPTGPAGRPADRLADVNGVRLAYDVRGQGPLVLCAHGLTSSRAAEDASALLDHDHIAAAAGRTVARYDARGHGRSQGRPVPDDYRWPALAGDLLALADLLQPHAPVAGIGASMGAATLLWAAVREPGRFDRLVLRIPPTAWQTRTAQAAVLAQSAKALEQAGLRAWLAAAGPSPQPPLFADDPLPVLPPAVPEELLPSVLRGAGASDLPDPEDLAKMGVPTLILAWAGDPGHPVSTAERLAALLPAADLHVATTRAELASWTGRVSGFLAGPGGVLG
ncbi:alpha/beta fold hydrolase [Nonomuraea sp. NPDC050310]|uniref:alpha/beta fold hydrolase n=1 Tax=unclassified Nonomuraea TaxID=2593643 RepID=UPI0033C7F8CE